MSRGAETSNDPTDSLQCVQRADRRRFLCAHGPRPLVDPQPFRRHQLRPWRIPRHRWLPRVCADSVRRLLGRPVDSAVPDGLPRLDRGALVDPSPLWPRSALQPAAHLRTCLHLRGQHALHMGCAERPLPGARLVDAAAELQVFLPHRIPVVHGAPRRCRGGRPVPDPDAQPPRHTHPRRHARSRDRLGTGCQRAHPAHPQFRPRHLPGRPRRRARRRHARLVADDRNLADHAELRRDHRRRPRQPAGHLAGRPPDRRCLGDHHRVRTLGDRGHHLRNDGIGAADPAARPARRGREGPVKRLPVNRLSSRTSSVIIWIVLLTLPLWMRAVGSYTELGTQVVVLALAAMIFGALIVKLRGVYFAMVTIAFGQVFYFITFRWNNVTGGDDGLTDWHRMPLDFGFAKLDILHNAEAFYYVILFCFAVSVGIMALLLRSPFGRTLLAIRENERRARFLGIPVDRHIWLSFVISGAFASVAGTLYALLNTFVDPRALFWGQSGNFVIMAVLGGMRSFWGPLVGAVIFVVLQDYVSSQTENWESFIGLFFVLVVLFFPRGVLGIIRRRTAP